MICPNCKNPETIPLYVDKFECDCGGVISIEYHDCEECGFVWRMNGNKFLDGGVLTHNTMDIFLESVFKAVYEDIQSEDEECEKMSDRVHHCLRCNDTALEVSKNNFMCVNCGFEWEVEDYGA